MEHVSTGGKRTQNLQGQRPGDGSIRHAVGKGAALPAKQGGIKIEMPLRIALAALKGHPDPVAGVHAYAGSSHAVILCGNLEAVNLRAQRLPLALRAQARIEKHRRCAVRAANIQRQRQGGTVKHRVIHRDGGILAGHVLVDFLNVLEIGFILGLFLMKGEHAKAHGGIGRGGQQQGRQGEDERQGQLAAPTRMRFPARLAENVHAHLLRHMQSGEPGVDRLAETVFLTHRKPTFPDAPAVCLALF